MKIKDDIENKQYPQEHREYLGMSQIGGDCKRKIWYDFRWCYESTIPARIKRLFERGFYEEEVLIKELINAGYKIDSTQIECIGSNEHIKGHPDIILSYNEGYKLILEIKTAKESIFKQFVKLGIKAHYPAYYAQAQCYMHSFSDIGECLFIITNKNTEERHYEPIYYNKKEAEHLFRIAEDIVFSKFPPNKIGDATFFKCKWCNAAEICHWGSAISINCRTCKNFLAHDNHFTCALTSNKLNKAEQLVGCDAYKQIEIR